MLWLLVSQQVFSSSGPGWVSPAAWMWVGQSLRIAPSWERWAGWPCLTGLAAQANWCCTPSNEGQVSSTLQASRPIRIISQTANCSISLCQERLLKDNNMFNLLDKIFIYIYFFVCSCETLNLVHALWLNSTLESVPYHFSILGSVLVPNTFSKDIWVD